MEFERLTQEVAKRYKDTESIKGTAKILNISPQKVRKILITLGLYTTASISEANRWYQQGLSLEAIAKQMNISSNAVSAMLPYQRSPYNVDLTENAQRIKACRARRADTTDTSQEPPD